MPWKDVSLLSQREEFVLLSRHEGAAISQLCRRFGVSRKTGYKWLGRFAESGRAGLSDRSRRPHRSPEQTTVELEQKVLALRDAHPAWGGRKLHARLLALGCPGAPAPSTITEILRRHGRLDQQECEKHGPCRRFEHDAPNRLWQMDFKGDFALTGGGRCHPLTIVDDYSRYAVCVRACANERTATVQGALIDVFRRYGLPERMLMDNGSCWGNCQRYRFTPLSAWLIRLGVGLSHGRPYHPQTQGKNERFNRTLKAEVLGNRFFRDLDHCQQQFDAWRPVYNYERPHEALAMQPPVVRYRPSPREHPEALPPINYAAADEVRRVHTHGGIHFQGKRFPVGNAFTGQRVALRPTLTEGIYQVYYCHQRVAEINVREGVPYKRKRK
jgi:transposase InsO family protein